MANKIPKIIYGDANTELVMSLPPIEDFRAEKINSKARTTISSGGVEQTQFNYNRETRSFKMTFIDESLMEEFRVFFKTHGSKGLAFSYFESSDEVEFTKVTLNTKRLSPKILFPNDSGGFVYEFDFSIVRTL